MDGYSISNHFVSSKRSRILITSGPLAANMTSNCLLFIVVKCKELWIFNDPILSFLPFRLYFMISLAITYLILDIGLSQRVSLQYLYLSLEWSKPCKAESSRITRKFVQGFRGRRWVFAKPLPWGRRIVKGKQAKRPFQGSIGTYMIALALALVFTVWQVDNWGILGDNTIRSTQAGNLY